MRRILLSALVLSPVVLQAQANLLPGNQAMLHASAIAPKGLMPVLARSASDKDSSDTHVATIAPDKIQMVITTGFEAAEELASQEAEMSGERSFSFGEPANTFVAPKLVHWTPIQCVEGDIETADAASKKLVLSMVISPTGEPSQIKIVHSVGPVLDHKAVEALSQYRFTPAMLDHRVAAAPAMVAINFPAQ